MLGLYIDIESERARERDRPGTLEAIEYTHFSLKFFNFYCVDSNIVSRALVSSGTLSSRGGALSRFGCLEMMMLYIREGSQELCGDSPREAPRAQVPKLTGKYVALH